MLALHADAKPVTPAVRRNTEELSPRLAQLIADTMDTPAYLRRLTLTPSTSIEALDAAVHLVMADWKAASAANRTDTRHQHTELPASPVEASPHLTTQLQDQP
ncbi:hypothetical protein [Kitasatospora sp. NPDC098663]|uniref:hypothetical protein n=1 Tax=Kitasatospora sp. NPDC098663 TaxID=3364096 RepID=UPI003808F83F